MKSFLLAALLCASASGNDFQQCWTRPFLEACIDSISVSGSHIRGHESNTEYFVLISLTTQDYRVKGFLIDLAVQFDDGIVRHIYRDNLPLPEKTGPAVLKVSTGDLKPTKAVLFYVQRLITDYATTLIPPPDLTGK